VTKKKEETVVVNPKAPLSQLMLDCGKDKYRMISLATRWAIEVQKRDQQVSHAPDELVSMAIKEILTGEVSLEEIEKLPPAPKLERRLEIPAAIPEDLVKRIAEEDARMEKAAASGKGGDEAPVKDDAGE
jgi:DNA-directed RNA polymerase subunit K/omega